MSLEIGETIKRIDVVNALLQSDDFLQYNAGNKFDDEPSIPYYTQTNIYDVIKSGVYISADSFSIDSFCKAITFPSSSKVIENTDLSAKFDSLVSMMATTFLPLTNIRYSTLSFLNKDSDGKYRNQDLTANISLADSAIVSSNDNFFINNLNDNSQFLISTINDFILCGNIADGIDSLRSQVAQTSYVADPAVARISVDTVRELSSIFISALNHIRKTLSCKFEDTAESKSEENILSVKYFQWSDGTGEISSRSAYKYSDISVDNYHWESDYFNGWTNEKHSTKMRYSNDVDFVPGDEIILTNDLSFYPSFKPTVIVRYNVSSDTDDLFNFGITKKFAYEDNYVLNEQFRIRGFNEVLDLNGAGRLSRNYKFIGWSDNTTSTNPAYKENDLVRFSKETVINLYPIIAGSYDCDITLLNDSAMEHYPIDSNGASENWVTLEPNNQLSANSTWKYNEPSNNLFICKGIIVTSEMVSHVFGYVPSGVKLRLWGSVSSAVSQDHRLYYKIGQDGTFIQIVAVGTSGMTVTGTVVIPLNEVSNSRDTTIYFRRKLNRGYPIPNGGTGKLIVKGLDFTTVVH